MNDADAVCASCGAPAAQQAAPMQAAAPVYADPADHTAEFSPEDISGNKVFALAAYVFGWVGMIVALLAAGQSAYAMFHVRQALKLSILSMLAGVVAVVLCWTFLVPIAAGVFYVVLFVVRVMAFVYVCQGKAKELPVVKSFGFLK